MDSHAYLPSDQHQDVSRFFKLEPDQSVYTEPQSYWPVPLPHQSLDQVGLQPYVDTREAFSVYPELPRPTSYHPLMPISTPEEHEVYNNDSSPFSFDPLEEASPITSPAQIRPSTSTGVPSAHSDHRMGMPFLPSNGLVQHTDDAASKESQFLRRRCYNCHTTEPPSWRRSTLNPGKIVCNKCGLYERTHVRPRPLRFDELRAGAKTRKPSMISPKAKSAIHKPYRDDNIPRRNTSASVDWDDTTSLLSATSEESETSASGGIRLPTAPLVDLQPLISLQTKSATVLTDSSLGSTSPRQPPPLYRRGSLPTRFSPSQLYIVPSWTHTDPRNETALVA